VLKAYSTWRGFSFSHAEIDPAFRKMVADAAAAANLTVGAFCVRALLEALPKAVPEPELVRRKRGRPPLNLTPEQKEERYQRRLELQRVYDARKRAKKRAAKAEAAKAAATVVRKRGRQPLTPEQKAASRERQLAYWRETAQRRRAAKWAAYEKYAQMGAEA
jgi:hypothetical protein